jgi:hypothetical protein
MTFIANSLFVKSGGKHHLELECWSEFCCAGHHTEEIDTGKHVWARQTAAM